MLYRFIITLILTVNTFCILNAQQASNYWGIASNSSLFDLGNIYNYSVSNDTNTVVTYYDTTYCFIYNSANKYRISSGLTIGPDGLVYGASRRDSAQKTIVYRVYPSEYMSMEGQEVNKIEIVHQFGYVPITMVPYWASNDSVYIGFTNITYSPPTSNDLEDSNIESTYYHTVVVKTDTSFNRIDTLFTTTEGAINPSPIEGKDGSLYVVTSGGFSDTLTRVTLYRLNKSTGDVLDSTIFPLNITAPKTFATHIYQDGGIMSCAANGHIYGIVDVTTDGQHSIILLDTLAALFEYIPENDSVIFHSFFTHDTGIPNPNLTENNGVIYGTTSRGSQNQHSGGVWSFNTNSSIFQMRNYFGTTINGYTRSPLTVLNDTTLIGIASTIGDTVYASTIFNFNTNTNDISRKNASLIFDSYLKPIVGYRNVGSLIGIDPVQWRLDEGETPIEIYRSNNDLLSEIYGKRYQGGLIAQLDTITGAGFVVPYSDQSSARFGCSNVWIHGSYHKSIGGGKLNTQNTLNYCSDNFTVNAQFIASTLNFNSYQDWYLPSKDELSAMYENLYSVGKGNFEEDGTYWTSTTFSSSNTAYAQTFNSSGTSLTQAETIKSRVRAIRYFGPFLNDQPSVEYVSSLVTDSSFRVFVKIDTNLSAMVTSGTIFYSTSITMSNEKSYDFQVHNLPFSEATLSGLTPGTEYFFQIKVSNPNRSSLRTPVQSNKTLPKITTLLVQNPVNADSVICSMNITSQEHIEISRAGYCWMIGTNGTPSVINNSFISTGNAPTYSDTIPPLLPHTEYIIVAYVELESGNIIYGNSVQFHTKSSPTISNNIIVADQPVYCVFDSLERISISISGSNAISQLGSVSYQWQGLSAEGSWSSISGEINANFRIEQASRLPHSQKYRRIVQINELADTSNIVTLRFIGKSSPMPLIIEQPSLDDGIIGLSAQFSNKLPIVNIQWQSFTQNKWVPIPYEKSTVLIPSSTLEGNTYKALASCGETCPVVSSKTIGFTPPDADGNIYLTTRMGNNLWMINNLRTSKNSDGQSIVSMNKKQWSNNPNALMTWYDNDSVSHAFTYGGLYNYTAAASSVCPANWSVPSPSEWKGVDYAVSIDNPYGAALHLKSPSSWTPLNNLSATPDLANFSALPAGKCDMDGTYWGFGTQGYWWTVNSSNLNVAETLPSQWMSSVSGDDHKVTLPDGASKQAGYAIRCTRQILNSNYTKGQYQGQNTSSATLEGALYLNGPILLENNNVELSSTFRVHTKIGENPILASTLIQFIPASQSFPDIESSEALSLLKPFGSFTTIKKIPNEDSLYKFRLVIAVSDTDYLVSPSSPPFSINQLQTQNFISNGNEIVCDGSSYMLTGSNVDSKPAPTITWESRNNTESVWQVFQNESSQNLILNTLPSDTTWYRRLIRFDQQPINYSNAVYITSRSPHELNVFVSNSDQNGISITTSSFNGALPIWEFQSTPTSTFQPTGDTSSTITLDVSDTTKRFRVKLLYAHDNCMVESNTFRITPPDGNDNLYAAVAINGTYWTMNNLNATYYNDEEGFHLASSIDEWASYTEASAITPSLTPTSDNHPKGLIYNHSTLLADANVCPEGWQIPSISDWKYLINLATELGERNPSSSLKMTEPRYNWYGNNTLNFNALPTRNIINAPNNELAWASNGESVSWWAATDSEVLPFAQVTMSNESNGLHLDTSEVLSNRSLGAAIRCIKSSKSDFPICTDTSYLSDVDMWFITQEGGFFYDGGINYWNSSSKQSSKFTSDNKNTSGLVLGPDNRLYGSKKSLENSVLYSFDPIHYKSYNYGFWGGEYRVYPYKERNSATFNLSVIHNGGDFMGDVLWASNNKMYGVITSPDTANLALTSLIYQVDSGMVNPTIIDTLQSNVFTGYITQGNNDSLLTTTYNPTNTTKLASIKVYALGDLSNPHSIDFPIQVHQDTLCAHYVRPFGPLLHVDNGAIYGLVLAEKVDTNCASFNDTIAALFQYKTQTGIDFIHYFTTSTGLPNEKLIQGNDGVIYGTTYGSGSSAVDSGGYIFSYNPLGGSYQNEVSFISINGMSGCQAGLTKLTPSIYLTSIDNTNRWNSQTSLIGFNSVTSKAMGNLNINSYDIGYSVKNALTRVDPIQERLNQGESPISIAQCLDNSVDKIIGKHYQGGIIASIDLKSKSGLIVAMEDLMDLPFGCSNLANKSMTLSDSIGFGKANTDSSLKFCPTISNAQAAAINYDKDGYSDWYLPSSDELNEIQLNLASNCIGGFKYGNYWSSSRTKSGDAIQVNMKDDSTTSVTWLERNHVRPVRTIQTPAAVYVNIDSIWYNQSNDILVDISVIPNEHYVNHSVLIYDTVPNFNSRAYSVIELSPKSGQINTSLTNDFLAGTHQYFKVIAYTLNNPISSKTVNLDVRLTLRTSTVGSELAPNYTYIDGVAMSGPEHLPKHKGICWDTKKHPKIEKDDTIQVSNHLLTFQIKLPSLQLNKTYYARTFFVDTNGEVFYGNEISFKTVSPQPIALNEIPTPIGVSCEHRSAGTLKMPLATGGADTVYYLWQKMIASDWVNVTEFTIDPNLIPIYSNSIDAASPYRRIASSTGILDTSNTIYVSQLPYNQTNNVVISEGPGETIGHPTLKAAFENDLGNTNYAWYMSGPQGNFIRMENETTDVVTPPLPDDNHFYRAVLSYGGGCPITSSKLISYTPNDGNGRPYATVRAFAQFWTISNSTATIYQNTGTSIPEVKSPGLWSSTTTPAYCWFDNTPQLFKYPYGALYNRYTINSTDSICPSGYHVAKTVDWNTLNSYVGGSDGATAGKELKSHDHWNSPNVVGSNLYNFNALPGGFRHSSGEFNSLGNAGHWWPDSEDDLNSYFKMIFDSPHNFFIEASDITNEGKSIRCVKNIP